MISLYYPNVSKKQLAQRLGSQLAYIREGLNGTAKNKTNEEKAEWLFEHILANLVDLNVLNQHNFKFDRIAKGNSWNV